MDRLYDTLEKLAAIDTRNLAYQVEYLQSIRDWALRHLGIDYGQGDRVVITVDQFTHPRDDRGHYAEAARAGATAVVESIEFNQFHNYWYALIVLDVEWSTAQTIGTRDEVTRYWHGPIGDMPEGMEPPSENDQRRHPNGRKHQFAVHLQHLRKAGPDEHQ